jgi:hypothetical protein
MSRIALVFTVSSLKVRPGGDFGLLLLTDTLAGQFLL